MTPRALRLGALGIAGLILITAAGFPATAALRVGASPSWGPVGDSVVHAALPALGLVWAVRLARDHRLASWAAFVGALLTLGLGVALYSVALRSGSPRAPIVAISLVPFRQLAAAAVVAWAVWTARKTR